MADETRLPPKTGKGRKGPEMMDEDPAIVSKLAQVAGMQEGGQMGGGGGTEEQSANLLMSGAQQMMQAAQMNPALQSFVGQAIQIIQRGVQQLAGGGGGVGGPPEMAERGGGGGARKRQKPPRMANEAEEDQFSY